MIFLRQPSEIKKLPDLYIDVMTNVAEDVVSKCSKEKESGE
mgnify:CR=1 FL=1